LRTTGKTQGAPSSVLYAKVHGIRKWHSIINWTYSCLKEGSVAESSKLLVYIYDRRPFIPSGPIFWERNFKGTIKILHRASTSIRATHISIGKHNIRNSNIKEVHYFSSDGRRFKESKADDNAHHVTFHTVTFVILAHENKSDRSENKWGELIMQ
jgi:hypothetical protein